MEHYEGKQRGDGGCQWQRTALGMSSTISRGSQVSDAGSYVISM